MKTAYEHDFYAWLMHNASLLQMGQLTDIDSTNIAEELESMGKSQQRALLSRLSVLLAHLLKWQYQSAMRSRSWSNTIDIQREDIADLLTDSPSLKAKLEQKLDKAYYRAKRLAENETGISQTQFPETCPYVLEQVFDNTFWPDEAHINT
jgi:hypothetical protein